MTALLLVIGLVLVGVVQVLSHRRVTALIKKVEGTPREIWTDGYEYGLRKRRQQRRGHLAVVVPLRSEAVQ